MKVILAVMKQLKQLERKPMQEQILIEISTGFAVHDLYHMHILTLSSYNGYRLNSLLTSYQQGFMAQLVESRGVQTPLKPQNFFWAFFVTALVASQLRGSLSLIIQWNLPEPQRPPLSFTEPKSRLVPPSVKLLLVKLPVSDHLS